MQARIAKKERSLSFLERKIFGMVIHAVILSMFRKCSARKAATVPMLNKVCTAQFSARANDGNDT